MTGALVNNGWATVITFPPKTFTSLTLLVTAVSSSTSNVGLAEIQVYGPGIPAPADLALVANAKSSTYAVGQGPEKAIDGSTMGYTPPPGNGDGTKEWSSNGQGAGATLTLTWSSAISANSITLYDRPNLSDQILGANITFMP